MLDNRLTNYTPSSSMFDSQRTFSTCAFCDSTELSAEHIFGRGLAKRLLLRSNWSAFDERQAKMVDGGAPLLSITSPILCEACNNQLGDSMRKAYGPLERLARTKGLAGRDLSPMEVEIFLRYFERLGFLIDRLTSNDEVPEGHLSRPEHQRNVRWRHRPPVYGRERRMSWMAGVPGIVPSVFIGRHIGVLGLPPFCNVASRLLLTADGPQLSKIFQIVFRGLAVALFIGSDRPVAPPASFVMLRPREKARTPSHPVTYADHFSLYNSDWSLVEHVRRLQNPSYRANFEADVRAKARADLQESSNWS
jgi:hypothetical protein